MKIGSLFSGYGGLDLAVQATLGGAVAWHAEIDPDASRVLGHHWPDVPNLGDISRVDWSQVEPVDVITGGFPCQDVSTAGKRAGLHPGTRSGLWSQMAYAVSVLRPRLVIAENVRGLLSAPAASQVEPCPWCLGDDADHALRALGAVLGDLADLGYDTAWCGLRASDVGAPHERFRVFVAAAHSAHGDQAHWPALGSPTGRAGRRLGGESGAGSRAGDRDSSARVRELGAGTGRVDFGGYDPVIRRWERVLGRPAPAPIVDGQRRSRVINPAFVEWMQGVPAGWVTGVPGLSRTAMSRILGNGVVPQQASAALPWLLDALDLPIGEAA